MEVVVLWTEVKDDSVAGQSIEFHRIWIDQCEATEGIRERFGLKDTLDYLIGEKLFTFVAASERDPSFAAELPPFVAEIRRLFTGEEIGEYLTNLERMRYLAPQEQHFYEDDVEDDDGEGLWLENPIMGAEELLRFARIRQLLLASESY